ncbi:MAG: BACON domain-containing protein [Pyrinomonadaceae bacterium]
MSKTQSRSESAQPNIRWHAGHIAQSKLLPVWVRCALACVVAALFVSAGVSHRVMADGGALDPTFNGTGTVTANFGGEDEAYAVAIQPDGRVVVVGTTHTNNQTDYKIALARYNPDGTLDQHFGNGGKVIGPAGDGFAVAIQPDGKILTSGFGAGDVTRFNSDGSLDTSFGSGGRSGHLVYPYTMILQPDGKILVGGYLIVSYHNTDYAVGRFNSDGTVDTSFGNGGKVTTEFYQGHDEIHALALEPDGKIVAAGQSTWGGSNYFATLARYDGSGSLDTSFGNQGKVTIDFSPNQGNKYHRLYAVAIQPDDKILAAGATRHYDDRDSFAIARFNKDGSPDATFGSGGQVTTKILGNTAAGSSLALQPDGKFFVGGYVSAGGYFTLDKSFALARYNVNGSLDTSFGLSNSGQVVTHIYGHQDSISGIALQPDGKVVAAGNAAGTDEGNGFYGDFDFALARYLVTGANPTPTPTPIPTPTPACTNFSISPASRSFAADGGNAFINVDTESYCTWTAQSNAAWLTVTSLVFDPYYGGGTVYYSVAPYTGTAPRTGTISIGTQTFTVYQGAEALQGAPDIVWIGTGHTAGANAVAFSPDGQLLASASNDHTVKLWRVADGALLTTLTGFFDPATSVAFSHNGQMLAAGSINSGVIKVWHVSDWSLLSTLTTSSYLKADVAFSPDDTRLAVASNGLELWNTSSWQKAAILEGGFTVVYSPDGQFLAAGVGYEGAKLYQLSNGFTRLLDHRDRVNSVAFTSDSQTLATGSDDQSVSLWQVANGSQVFNLNGPSGFVKGVAFSPDGQIILAGGQDLLASRGTLLFWRVADGALMRTYIGQTSAGVLAVQYSPNGALYAYARADGVVVVARNPFSPCAQATITPTSQTFTASGGDGQINISSATGCNWTAVASADWITINIGLSGNGNSTLTYTVAANTDAAPRSATLSVAGQTFNVTQDGLTTHNITGRVTDAQGNPLDGATLNMTGTRAAAITTDGNGNYSFASLPADGGYTLTPVYPGFAFSPQSRSINNMSGDMTADFTVTQAAPAPLLISEFRLRGSAGSQDEFIELYNNTNQPLTIATNDGSAGWTLAKPDAIGTGAAVLCVIPNGTTIPARGHYLVGNNSAGDGYSLSVALDQTYSTDVGDAAGIALFSTALPAHLTLAYRLDAAGFAGQTGSATTLYWEGAGLPSASGAAQTSAQSAYVRRQTTGTPQDTGDNAQDFVLISTTGMVGGAQAVLGAPGPENAASPSQRNAQLKASLIDPQASSTAAPNRVRDVTPVTNGAQGTLTVRRKFTNKTGAPVTALRFRIIDITTLNTPNPGGAQADLRALDAVDVLVQTTGGAAVLVKGTTLAAPAQPNGGGLNSALVVQLPGGALANGASLNVQFVLGVEQGGSFRFLVNVEALTGGAAANPQKVRGK